MDLAEAERIALGLVSAGAFERVGLEDALGRVLAEPVAASLDLPGEPRSRFDGYAFASADVGGASRELPHALTVRDGLLAAGCAAGVVELGAGHCIRILTGAPLPMGADAVAREEDAWRGDGCITLDRSYSAGEGVVPLGSDVRAGAPVLPEGCVLTPSRLALLAALERVDAAVYARPRVAVLATGDELREPGQSSSRPFSICNGRLLLEWLVRLHGGEALSLGIARDDPEEIASRLDDADADFVVTTGGTGRGDRDFISPVWNALGIETRFSRINLHPGGSCALGTRNGRVYCALSGSPWAARAAFEVLLVPMLWRFQGLGADRPPETAAILGAAVEGRRGSHCMVHGLLDAASRPPSFTPNRESDSPLFSMLKSNPAYILLDPQRAGAAAGEWVLVRLHDFPLAGLPLFLADLKAPPALLP